MEAFLADGDENTISVTRRGSYVKNMNYEDYIELGKLTEEQEELLREVMSEDFRSEIPSFGVGSDVANLALTKVGCRYSRNTGMKRDTMTAAPWCRDVMQSSALICPLLRLHKGSISWNTA